MESHSRSLLVPVTITAVLCNRISGIWFVIMLAISPALYAQVAPEIGNLRYTVDYHDSYSIEQIRSDLEISKVDKANLGWIYPNNTVISLGFHREPHWFSWSIHPDDIAAELRSPANQYILEVPFPSIDHLNVWVFDQNNNLLLSEYIGDSQRFDARKISSRKFLFPVEWDEQTALTVVMRIKTTDTVRFNSQFWAAETFWASEEQHTLSHGIYVGVIAAMFFLYISLAAGMREKSFFYYTFWLTFMSLAIIADLGYGFEYLWPESVYWNDRAHAVFICLGMFIGTLFFGEALSINLTTNPVIGRLLRMITGICFASAVCCLFLPNFYTVQLTTVSAVSVVALLIVIVVQKFKEANIQTGLLLLAICIVGSVGTIRILNNFGYVSSVANIEYYLEIATGIEVVLLSIFLAVRFYTDRRKRLEAQQELISLQKTMYTDLEKIVEERTQELESLNKLLAETSVTDPLTGLKNRRYFDENIKKLINYSSRAHKGVAVMMIDLDHFKKINDGYGHQIGDKCLSHFADILRSVVNRDTDIVSRYGGEEFIVALANRESREAINKAELIRSELDKLPLISNDVCIKLTCSIGVAHANAAKNTNADLLVKQADAALYQAKNAGRNRVETLNGWDQSPGTSAA